MRSTNYEKFRLLLWKNWILHWNHKLDFFYELCAPMLVSLLLVALRLIVQSTPVETVRYNTTFEMTDFGLLFQNQHEKVVPCLGFSPARCTLCRKVMEEVGNQTGVEIHPFESSKSLEAGTNNLSLIAGVDFGDEDKHTSAFPKKLQFSIRFPSELRTSRNVLEIWNTNRLFLPLDPSGPRNRQDEDGGTPSGYLREGFLTIQNQVSLAFIKLSSSSQQAFPSILMKRFPHPPFVEDPLLHNLSTLMSFIVMLGYIQPAIYTVKCVALERERHLKEVLQIMGLPNWLHWAAWFVKTFTIMFVSTILVTYVLTTKWSNDVAVFTGSSFSAILVFLVVYVTASITFCFMMATFFNNASTAAAVTGLFWVTSFFPYTYIGMNYDSVSMTSKLLWCTLSNTSMGLGMRIITEWEMLGHGMSWDKIFKQYCTGDPLKMIHVINMMLAMAAVHMLICLYVEQLRPGLYGASKPWFFPFQRRFWLRQTVGDRHTDAVNDIERDPSHFEDEPIDMEEVVVLRHLSKSYDGKPAVKNLSFSLYINEITVLLGHNGAGKSTTISMLMGMTPPTSGTAFVLGHDIRTDIDGVREYLSVCPQYNVLFDDLSVRDHLEFFAYLRGFRGGDLEEEIMSCLEKADLTKMADILSKDLSAGMKRKLSVCCAFCGGASVVFCDDPSLGMDPTARRELWNILQDEKEGRVILLTTHFMDEADVLADRVAILALGQLQCYGTTFFLKKKFGSGYTLICVKEKDCSSSSVTEILQRFIPDLEVSSESDTEISYVLEEEHSPKFAQMLAQFEAAMKDVNVCGFGLSQATLEEVFLKTSTEIFSKESNEQDLETINSILSASERLKGRRLWCSQFQAMILKKYLNMRCNWPVMAVQILLVIAFVLLTVMIRATEVYNPQNSMTLELRLYKEGKIVLDPPKVSTKALENLINNLEDIVTESGTKHGLVFTHSMSIDEFILIIPARRRHVVTKTYLAGFTMSDDQWLIRLNNKPLHSAPIALNLLHNALARTILGQDTEIVVKNHPLPYRQSTKVFLASTGLGMGTQLSFNVGFCMSLITASLSLFVIKERQSRAKLLQFVSGVEWLTFWGTHFILDFCYLTVLGVVFMVAVSAFEEETYSEFDELARNLIVIPCFAFSAVPLTYLMSRGYSEPANGFAKLSLLNLTFGMGSFALALILSFETLRAEDVENNFETLTLLYPHFALAKALHDLYINHKMNIVCDPLSGLDDARMCKLHEKCCEMTRYFAWDKPGIGRPLAYLLTSGLLYSSLIVLIQNHLLGALWNKFHARQSSRKYVVPKPKDLDSDVEEERKLIDKMTRRDILDYNLVMKRLTKFYGNSLAVNQISVAVKEGECFGLLGLNGAGKSTIFKMLTSDVRTTFGTAYVRGMNIQAQTMAVYQEIGYCPQFGGLFEDFTGRETLRLFAMIHGVPKRNIDQLSENLAKAFGFMRHYDHRVGDYRRGSRRKLGVAVAVIGGPSLVLLDDPTSGMEPISRHRLWNVINSMRRAGKSIILTSHSMDECVALCTRMAIMVNREFRCLGSIQHLRIKYSQGLILRIKVLSVQYPRRSRSSKGASLRRQTDVRERAVDLWVQKKFPDAELIDNFQGLLSFNIPMTENLWSRIFGEMEFVKEALFIEDYSIAQTDLEDIFLFLNKQK